MARPFDGFPPGQISMSDAQRTWAQISLTDMVHVQIYDPFSQGGQAYLGSMDVEAGFASQKKRTDVPYDQDDLAKHLTKVGLISS
jgi:vesicle-fusing ATPase